MEEFCAAILRTRFCHARGLASWSCPVRPATPTQASTLPHHNPRKCQTQHPEPMAPRRSMNPPARPLPPWSPPKSSQQVSSPAGDASEHGANPPAQMRSRSTIAKSVCGEWKLKLGKDISDGACQALTKHLGCGTPRSSWSA